MSHSIHILLAVTILLVALPQAYAFGAGDIPDFAYLNDRAYRHGDIENILENLVKYAGHASAGGGLLGFASQVIKEASGGSKFSKNDIKKVYFGNWLRDYSQAMDIAGLSKLSADTLVLVVSVLGFMTFGFATEEFEVTADRLGVYLCTEHIDNPKGYAEKEGDAREFHPKLRPPVDPRELEIDERTGMKKYMATENEDWDTSTALIRRVFKECIKRGRRSGGKEGPDLFEAYRLLGSGLHTLEDLLAHSNWCELALRKMGHDEVFCHVGENVLVEAPSGDRVPPLVTGTFGSADFVHSLLGEATDKLSQASVTALSDNLSQSQNSDTAEKLSALKNILGKIGGGDDKVSQGEELQAKSQAYHFDPDNVAPPEVQQQLTELLKWHDDLFRDITKKIEMVPGLGDLLDEMSNALNAYVYTVIAPWVTPILSQTTSVLGEGSKAVIDNDDQFEVFNNPDASDPSHSLLSKDHFGLVLNEPAGKIAQTVVVYSVQLIVQAWSEDENADRVIDQILEAFHHPYYASGRSEIQRKMFDEMEKWLGGLGEEASGVISKLTKESVKEGKNKREGEAGEEAGYGGCGHGAGSGNYAKKQSQSYGGQHSSNQQSYGVQQQSSHSRNEESGNERYGRQQQQQSSYGRNEQSRNDGYGRQQQQQSSYGRTEESTYNSGNEAYGRQQHQPYGGNQESYGGRVHEERTSSNRQEGYGGRTESSGYESGRREKETHGRGHDDSENRYGTLPLMEAKITALQGRYAPSYGGEDHSSGGGHGGRGYGGESDSYGRQEERREGYRPVYGGGYEEPPRHHGGGHHGGRRHENRDDQETFGAERMNIRDDGESYGRHRDNDSGY